MATAREDPSPAARERDAGATKTAIRDAAVELFCRHGYDGAGTREIAAHAGVDPRLITRYFGSKEGLFAAVVEKTFAKELPMGPGHEAAAASALLREDPPEFDGLMLTLRSAGNPRAAAVMQAHMKANYQLQLTESLSGDDTEARAALLIAICAGVQLVRNVLRDPALTDADVERLAPRLAAALEVISRDEHDCG